MKNNQQIIFYLLTEQYLLPHNLKEYIKSRMLENKLWKVYLFLQLSTFLVLKKS